MTNPDETLDRRKAARAEAKASSAIRKSSLLARALFIEDLGKQKLDPHEKRALWKEKSKSYHVKARRLLKRIDALVGKGVSEFT